MKIWTSELRKLHGEKIKKALANTNKRVGNPNAAEHIRIVNAARWKAAQEFADKLYIIVKPYVEQGLSQRKIVNVLNINGVPAPKGGKWVLSQYQKVFTRGKARLNF